MAEESVTGGAASYGNQASAVASPGTAASRTRARSFEITDAADQMLKNFKRVGGVNYRVQIDRMLKFIAERGRANNDQFFNLVMHNQFTEHEARQMIQLLAGEFGLRVDVRPMEPHA